MFESEHDFPSTILIFGSGVREIFYDFLCSFPIFHNLAKGVPEHKSEKSNQICKQKIN